MWSVGRLGQGGFTLFSIMVLYVQWGFFHLFIYTYLNEHLNGNVPTLSKFGRRGSGSGIRTGADIHSGDPAGLHKGRVCNLRNVSATLWGWGRNELH